MADLKAEIARIVYWKQRISEHDAGKALPWHLPNIGANAEEIASAERVTEIEFPESMKTFLELANGWKGFILTVDLFGTAELASPAGSAVLLREDVVEVLRDKGIGIKHALCIGASAVELDVFVLVSRDSTAHPGEVVWIAGDEVDTFANFDEFIASMVNYNAQVVQRLSDARN